MSQRKRSPEDLAVGLSRPPPLPERRPDPRGPRVLDPFACETLTYPRLSTRDVGGDPLDEPTLVRPGLEPIGATAAGNEALEDPTIVYRPWAREFAEKPSALALDALLAKTLARPVQAPMALAIQNRPVTRVGPKPRRPFLRQGIAALILAALALLGVRALTARQRTVPAKLRTAAASSSSRAVIPVRPSADQRAARANDSRDNAGPPPTVNGKTAERQAVDLVARGAYSEAAELYEELARGSDVAAFGEAARIARRKASLAR
jgi:hypothetical protein